ncbi:MAG: hypothetical protein ACOX5Z_07675 [Desulfobulbus sp.]|jgi:collagenase-like PrtC family protease
MTPYLNVPFLPDPSYIDVLLQCEDELDCLQFPIPSASGGDYRSRRNASTDELNLLAGLERLPGPKKYALLNDRFHDPALLTTPGRLAPLIAFLGEALEHEVVDGLIYADHYLLHRIADQAPEIATRLEAVPSVDLMLDSQLKIELQIDAIAQTGFQAPEKITLDRSLNRDLDTMATLAMELHQLFPGMRIEALANEGCLPFCPFKPAHDAYAALDRIEGDNRLPALNRDLGCRRILAKQPYRILQSPFIRPEDVDLYLYHIDTIKLCSHTQNTGFLIRAMSAYRNRRYDGNLLDLLDNMEWMTRWLYVDNTQLSFDFANILSQCDKRCDRCGFCAELLGSIARRRPPAPSLPENHRLPVVDSSSRQG